MAVAGLGRVGALYPEPAGMPPRTHLSAIRATPGLVVAAIVDPDPSARAAARQRHGLGSKAVEAESLADLPEDIRPSMVVLAGPAHARSDGMAAALARGARLVFCEKPLAGTAAVAERILSAAAGAGAAIRVNFQRRMDPAHVRARAAFSGRPLAVQIRYANGLENYGSHLIDFLLDWLEPPAKVRAESPGDGESPSFRLRYADGLEATAIGLVGAGYDVFEIDLHYAQGRLELANGGVERRVWRPLADRHYPGYTHLALDAHASSNGPVEGLHQFYAAARDYLCEGAPLPGCDGAAALLGLRIIGAIRHSAAGGIWMNVKGGATDEAE